MKKISFMVWGVPQGHEMLRWIWSTGES